MKTFTIQQNEIKRIQTLDIEDKEIIIDDIELEEVDENGDNFGLSFKAFQSVAFKTDAGSCYCPPSFELAEHEVSISELKVFDTNCNDVELTQEEYQELDKKIIYLIKNS